MAESFDSRLVKLFESDRLGSAKDASWDPIERKHTCCGIPRAYYHAANCPLVTKDFKSIRLKDIKRKRKSIATDEVSGLVVRASAAQGRKNDLKIAAAYAMYTTPREEDGKLPSIADVAKVYGCTRQNMHDSFKARGYQLRSKQINESIVFDEIRWIMNTKKTAMRGTVPGRGRIYLHSYIWEKNNGPMPAGHSIRIINRDPKDTRIENLELLTTAEMTRKYSPFLNQFTAPNGSRIIRRGMYDRDPILAATPRFQPKPMRIDEHGIPWKSCTNCGIEKPIAEFYPRYRTAGRGNTGTSHCRICINTRAKENRLIRLGKIQSKTPRNTRGSTS